MNTPEIEIRQHKDGSGYFIAKRGFINPLFNRIGVKTTRLTEEEALRAKARVEREIKEHIKMRVEESS